jgi:hypothetical protein
MKPGNLARGNALSEIGGQWQEKKIKLLLLCTSLDFLK